MHIHIVSLPFDSGVRNVRMGNGPRYLLDAGLPEHLQGQGHQVEITEINPALDPLTPEPTIMLQLNRQLATVVADALRNDAFPLVLAGSCYTAIGTVTGMGADRTGVFWFDSHADFNTPDTSGSGFLDGMAITMLTGRSWRHLLTGLADYQPVPENHVCLVGVRDIDPAERALLDTSAVQVVGPDGLAGDLQRVLTSLPSTIDQAYLHLDLDVLDPDTARANALTAPDGPDIAQTAAAIALIGAALPIRGMALSAFDPGIGDGERVSGAAWTLVEQALRP